MRFVSFLVQDRQGNVQSGVQITINNAGTSTAAAIYDANGASIPNPTYSDVNGYVGFAAADGYYDAVGTLVDGSPVDRTNIAVFDVAADATAAAASAATASAASTNATNQAGIATTQAGIATTQAGIATTAATNAQTGTPNRKSVRLIAASALPANTYANGSAGVGATITITATGVLTVDGKTVNLNDDIIVAAEGTAANNGFYTCTTAGATGVSAVLTRRATENTPSTLGFACALATDGTALAGYGYRVVNDPATITIGTTAISVVQSASSQGVSGEAAIRAAADTTIHTVLDPIGAHLPPGYTSRSGWFWALIDSARRILIGVDTTGLTQFLTNVKFSGVVTFVQALALSALTLGGANISFLSNYSRSGWARVVVDSAKRILHGMSTDGSYKWYVAVKFYGAATFNAAITFVQQVAFSSLKLGSQAVAYGSGYLPSRSGWIWARIDSVGRIIFGQKSDGTLWAWGVRLATTADITGTGIQDKGLNGASYQAYSKADGGNKRQVFVRNKSTGKITQVTSAGSNNFNPVFDSGEVNVLFTTDRSPLPPASLMYVPVGGGTEAPQLCNPSVSDVWGDSLSAGTGSTGGNTYPAQLAALIGGSWIANNYGVGGQSSTQIAARMGAVATTITATGNSITGNGGSTVLTAVSPSLLGIAQTSTDGSTRSVTGTIVGVHGVLTRTPAGSSGSYTDAYTFVSDSGTTTTSCPSGSAFVPDALALTRDHFAWICVGRNNYSSTSQVESDITAMINLLRPLVKKVLLFSVLNGNYPGAEYSGNTGYTQITTLNSWMRSTYPQHYVVDSSGRDLRQRLVASYNAGLSLDVTANGNDTIPPSLHAMSGSIGTLTAAITTTPAAGTSETINLSAAATVNHVIQINNEQMAVTTGGMTATVTRGYNGTTPATHANTTSVSQEDSVHLNNAGYAVWAQIANEFITAQGLLN